MIFRRKNSNDNSFSLGKSIANGKITSKLEILYRVVICFTTACLCSMVLEVGARSPLGHSVTNPAVFNTIFGRSYNIKIKILITDIVMGLITTIMLALGDLYDNPYLYIPWLSHIARGILYCEGPTLLGLANVWLPDARIPKRVFISITLLLFAEQMCLWFNVFASLENSWFEYTAQKNRAVIKSEEKTSLLNNNKITNNSKEKNNENTLEISRLQIQSTELIDKTIKSNSDTAGKTTSSHTKITLELTKHSNKEIHDNHSKTPSVTA